MKLGDNFPHRVTIRLSDTQYVFIQEICDTLGMSSSEFFRMLIDSNISKIRGVSYEYKETDSDN